MKMSNKILLGTIIIIFVVPFLLAMTLKSKIDDGIYTIEKNNPYGEGSEKRQGSFAAYSSVKIIAPSPQLLECHLKQSADNSFNYVTDGSGDSVSVFSVNDTLYIQYISATGTEKKNAEGFGKISLTVNLPNISRLHVDGATVMLHDAFTSEETLTITLKNKGIIKDAVKVDAPTPPEPQDAGKNEKEGFGNETVSGDLVTVPAAGKLISQPLKEVLIYHLL